MFGVADLGITLRVGSVVAKPGKVPERLASGDRAMVFEEMKDNIFARARQDRAVHDPRVAWQLWR